MRTPEPSGSISFRLLDDQIPAADPIKAPSTAPQARSFRCVDTGGVPTTKAGGPIFIRALPVNMKQYITCIWRDPVVICMPQAAHWARAFITVVGIGGGNCE